MPQVCAGCGKGECTEVCPSCGEAGIVPPTRFCSQECFKTNWKTHKKLHTEAKDSFAKNGWWLRTVAPGDGENFPKAGDVVLMSFTGTLESGKVYDTNPEFEIKIGKGLVIKGWDEAVPQMSVGEKAKLIVKPEKAYGNKGWAPVIPPNETLIYDLQLSEINPPPLPPKPGAKPAPMPKKGR